MLNNLASKDSLRLVCCSVGDEIYCLDMDAVQSILRTDLLQRNPGKEGPFGWLLGTLTEIPVYTLASRIGSRADVNFKEGRVVVINSKPEPWGLLVDRVSRVMQASARDVSPVPQAVQTGSGSYFQGVVRVADRLMLYLSTDRLCPDAKPEDWAGREPRYRSDRLQPERIPARNIGARAQVLLFSTGGRDGDRQEVLFCLSLNQVLQILDPLPIIPVPSAPAQVLGLTAWRDYPVPVIDLNISLGLDPVDAESNTRFLIARGMNHESLFAFAINPGVKLHSLPLDHKPYRRAGIVRRELIRGVYEMNQQTLIVPDLDAIVSSDSSDLVEAALPMHQQLVSTVR